MKINSELERILLAQQQAQTAKTKSADSSAAFDDILQNALQKPDATSTNEEISLTSLGISHQHMNAQKAETAQSAPMGGAAPMTGTSAEDEEENDEYDVLSLMADIENSLSGLDEYTKNLQNLSSDSDLKQAWKELSAFSQSVNGLRQNYASLSQKDSSLDAVINDLEIMAVTETYKFNRGDYNL
ncbi:MAG: hypothetical protein K2O76_05520 [Mailhella sp.]|nr:hypothetical protein [Mailhella sp.]